jgi:hypothetical protein
MTLAKIVLSSIICFAKETSHTNIIAMEALHRHDLADWSCVYKETIQFNRLLAKRLKLHKHVTISKVNLNTHHVTNNGQHMNYKRTEKTCQQIAELLQQKVGARANNAIPLEYKEGTVHEDATSGKHEEKTAESQGNEDNETLVDPSPNSVVPSEGKQHQKIWMSTRKRKLSGKLSKDFL